MNQTTKLNPPRKKIYHLGKLVNERGDVSALCFSRSKAINLSVALWTNCPEAVTCPKCIRLLNEMTKEKS